MIVIPKKGLVQGRRSYGLSENNSTAPGDFPVEMPRPNSDKVDVLYLFLLYPGEIQRRKRWASLALSSEHEKPGFHTLNIPRSNRAGFKARVHQQSELRPRLRRLPYCLKE